MQKITKSTGGLYCEALLGWLYRSSTVRGKVQVQVVDERGMHDIVFAEKKKLFLKVFLKINLIIFTVTNIK